MLKILAVLLFGLLSHEASAFEREDGFVDLGMIENVIVNGAEVSGDLNKLKTIIPQISAVVRTRSGSETADCSGVLIAPDVVLTAAHCLGAEQNAFAVSVQFGSYAHLVSEVVRHPNFSGISFLPFGKGNQITGFNDIALIFLQRPVKGVRPALLPPQKSRIKGQKPLLLLGFGKTSKQGKKSAKLQWTEAPAMEGSRSRLVVKSKRISCKGDSVGPALEQHASRFVVRGITSVGDCETYAYYTRVSDYVDWILAEIAQFRSQQEI